MPARMGGLDSKVKAGWDAIPGGAIARVKASSNPTPYQQKSELGRCPNVSAAAPGKTLFVKDPPGRPVKC